MGNKQIKFILSITLSEISTLDIRAELSVFLNSYTLSVVRAIFPAQPSKTMVKNLPFCRVTHEQCGKNRKNRPSHPVQSNTYII